MNKKSLIVASIAVTVVAVALLLALGGKSQTKEVAKSTPKESLEKSSFAEFNKSPKEKQLEKSMQKRVKKEEKDSVEVVISESNLEEELEDLHKERSFEPLSVAELSQEMPYREFVEPVTAVVMPKEEFQDLHVGNKINFMDIEGMNYSVELKGVEPMNGSSSYFGKIESSDGMKYSTIVTIGEDGSGYIHLATSKGVYEIELKDGKGYVYRSRDINRALGDKKSDDFLVKKLSQN